MKANEQACPRCAEPVKLDATACRHCGYEFTAKEIAAAQAKKKAQARKGLFGCLGCGGLIAVIAIIGAIGGGSSTSGNEAEASRLEAAADKIDAEADRVERGGGKQAFVAQYKAIIQAASPCDTAVQDFATAAQEAGTSGDAMAFLATATESHRICQKTAATIGAMEAPADLPKAARKAVSKALASCTTAYSLRERALATGMKVGAGQGGRNGTQSVIDDLKMAQAGSINCIVGYFGASDAAGVKTDQLK